MAGQIKRYDPDLAAALFVTLGGNLPNRFDREEEAQSLAQKLPNREQRLKYIIELCARPDSPQTRYLTAKAYSWLGDAYRREIIRFCTEYLEGEPWSALPRGTVVEDGITIYRPARERASVLMDLAQAQDADGRHSAALASFLEAYRLEPYNPMPAIKAAAPWRADAAAVTETRRGVRGDVPEANEAQKGNGFPWRAFASASAVRTR